jgi:two-component system sensor kinase FixL
MNRAWHQKHKMPKNASLEERLNWHLAHQQQCACRAVPRKLAALVRSKRRNPKLRLRDAPPKKESPREPPVDVFRLLVEGLKDFAIYMLDPRGLVTSWNPGAERIKGYRAEEIIGKPFSLFYAAEDLQAGKPQRSLEAAEKSGRFEEEAIRVRKDGSRFWAHVVLTALRNSDGRLRGFAKVTRDITEHRRAEERFHALLEAAPDAMVIVDQAGKITLVNAQTEKLFGYSRAELLGQHIELLVPENLRTGHIAHRTNFAREPRTRPMGESLELTARRKDGTQFSVEISLSPIRTEGGLLVASSIRDVTVRKRMERLSTFGQLVGSIGHELRNPLGVIESSLFILKTRLGDDERTNKHIRRIGEQLQIANEIVSKLLEMIRDRPLVRSDVTLTEVLATATASIDWPPEVRLVQNGLDLLPAIPGDAGQLRQVLLNLIQNAVQAVAPKGEVKIAGTIRGSDVELSVEDTGPGVQASVRNRIFEPLVTTKAQGIGLGLALVKRIVERHGGSIAYEPAATGGARFVIRLPRGAAPVQSSSSSFAESR